MRYKYTKFTGDDLEGLDLEELLSMLSDLLLSSGFDSPYGDPFGGDGDHSLQTLHDAILDALLNGDLLPDETVERLLGDPADGDGRTRLEELIEEIIERMAQEGYITMPPDLEAERRHREGSGLGDWQDGEMPPVSFEITDKSLDFLGYRALRDLLGTVGKSSLGRHDTRDQATGRRRERHRQAVRVRRHAQPGSERHHSERGAACGPPRPGSGWSRDRGRLRGPRGDARRIPKLLRHGGHARLQPQHDPCTAKTGSPRPNGSRWRSQT